MCVSPQSVHGGSVSEGMSQLFPLQAEVLLLRFNPQPEPPTRASQLQR